MAKRRERPPRQADVARLAGVSQSAVSRVLAGDPDSARIPEETRQRILAAVRELGYVPNVSARNLRNKRNHLLGVHTFEPVFPHARDDFYFEFLLGIEERAEELGYDLVLFTSTGAGDGRRRVYRDGINRLNLADGSVLLGVSTDKDDLARLWNDGYPFVHIGRREVPGADIPCIVPDYAGTTGELIELLVQQGHRHFAYLRCSHDIEPFADRRRGYTEAVERLGLIDHGMSDLDEEWLDHLADGPATAVVADNGTLAEALRKGLAIRGSHVPEDVSVVVLDGTEPRDAPSWYTLSIPRKHIGRVAVDALVALVNNPEQRGQSIVVPCSIIPGTTIAPARPRRPT